MEHAAKDILIVIDMQNDFVTGALGTKEAQAILPALTKKVQSFDGLLLFTQDTHQQNYLDTQEGAYLPVPHCIAGSSGHALCAPLNATQKEREARVFEKNTFGSLELAAFLQALPYPIKRITLVGVCTDICVVSNALLIKAFLPETPLAVDAACCAGVTKEKHLSALETMRSCQIEVYDPPVKQPHK